jgi:hypothetical protein
MRTAHAVVMALLGLTGAEELTQQVDQQISAEDNQLCENEFMELDDESLAELDKASYQNHAKIAAENKKILATEKMCSKWVQTHKRHNVICKWCSKTVKPSTHWKFYKNVWYRWEGGKWHYWGPSRGGYGGAWRWSGGYWHHGGFAYKYVNGHWYRFYNHKWHYYKKMIPINPQRPRTPVTCVHVMQMVKAGIPDSLTAHSVSRCQVGRSIYMYDGRACKILGGRKVSQKLAKCKSGYAHKWRKVKRCTGGDLYKPMAPREILNVRWGRIAGSANDIGFGGGKIWVIGNNIEGGGYGIYRRDGNKWTKISGSAQRIAVKPDGNAMVTNKQAAIYDYTGKKWNRWPGAAWDIGVSSKGKVWVIGTNREAGGYGIYRRDGSRWTKIGGSALKIAVNGKGNAWVVNKYSNIYEYDGKRWHHRPGKATDVGAYDNAVMVVGTDNRYYRYNHM